MLIDLTEKTIEPDSGEFEAPAAQGPLSPELLHNINAYWRAANYLSVGQIYLYDNPLLKEPLKLSHVSVARILQRPFRQRFQIGV
jgi:phosphoketolase